MRNDLREVNLLFKNLNCDVKRSIKNYYDVYIKDYEQLLNIDFKQLYEYCNLHLITLQIFFISKNDIYHIYNISDGYDKLKDGLEGELNEIRNKIINIKKVV